MMPSNVLESGRPGFKSGGKCLMWGLCRSAPSALHVSFASKLITQFWRCAPTT
jgi:hypothetical protein